MILLTSAPPPVLLAYALGHTGGMSAEKNPGADRYSTPGIRFRVFLLIEAVSTSCLVYEGPTVLTLVRRITNAAELRQ